MRLKNCSYGLLAVLGLVGGMFCLYLCQSSPDSVSLIGNPVTFAINHPLLVGVVLDVLIVGAAFVMPLFLLMRESKLQAVSVAQGNSDYD